MFFNKLKARQFKMEDGYASVQEMLLDVISTISENDFRTTKITVCLPSNKSGELYTDKLSISQLKNDKFKFSLFESEAQSYLYNKIVSENEIESEIIKLVNLSGNAKRSGYEFEEF